MREEMLSKMELELDYQRNRETQMVKHLPTMQETWVQSLGQEDLLEKEMATHSSILAWRIPWMEDPGGYSPWGHKESDTSLHFKPVKLTKRNLMKSGVKVSALLRES